MTASNGSGPPAAACPTILPSAVIGGADHSDIGTPVDPTAPVGDDVWSTRYHGFLLPGPLRPVEPAKDAENYIVPAVTGTGVLTKYPRATTVAEVLDGGELLSRWQIRQTLKGVHTHPDLMSGFCPDDSRYPGKMRINEVADRAMIVAGAHRSSELGTAVHAWIAAVEVGQVGVDQVPDMFAGYVRAYLATMTADGVNVVEGLIERQVYTSVTGTVGTFDRVVQLPDGTVAVADIKTKTDRALRYGWLSIGIQLDIYARAAAILAEDCSRWERPPAVSPDVGVVIHVPSDASPPRCVIRGVNLRNGRAGTDLALQVLTARATAENQVPVGLAGIATRR